MNERLALKARLKRTWTPFFERYGNFTAVQLAAIPALLDGQNVVIGAPTAQGKTEAAVAPLVERFRPDSSLSILYLTPTRALANDLLARLAAPLTFLRLSLAIKTRDQNTFDPQHPAYFLISTPESVNSLLTSQAGIFTDLRAVVLDELHLFDGTPRGDQLRVLLNRIRRIRDYAFSQMQTSDAAIQYVALSATLPDPAAAARYFPVDQVIQVAGQRPLDAELIAMLPDTADALIEYLYTFRSRGWRKALVFCNSRAEVEHYAAAIRQNSPFGEAVYVHYSNISPIRRREIEQQFSQAEVAVCCATSTLELGIDIGTIDVVLLIGPPGDEASFVQRIGRGNRRQAVIRVACFYRTPLEKLLFETLCVPGLDADPPSASFRPSVAIQQVFSLLKQSPTGSVRLNELATLFETMLSLDDLSAILGELQTRRYLQPGRPGEWKPGTELNTLFDQQVSQTNDLSIYSNIQTKAAHQIEIRDQHTGQSRARVDVRWLNRPALTLEGRPINVEWMDGEAIWITTARSDSGSVQPPYRSAQKHLSYDLARRLPLQLGFAPGATPLVSTLEGWWWFHWLGDIYGRVLAGLLSYHFRVEETTQPGLCVRLENINSFSLPVWTFEQVQRYLNDHYPSLERLLDLGPFHHLLSPLQRRRAVVEQFDIRRFVAAIAALHPFRTENGSSLSELLLK